MNLNYDNEYEIVDDVMRCHDKDSICLFSDYVGYNTETGIIDTHWHEWLEISYIINGSMQIQTHAGTYEVKEGEVAVFGMKTLHRIEGKQGNYRFQCMHINMGFILQYIPASILLNEVLVIRNNEEFLSSFSNIIHYMSHEDVISELKFKSALLNLIALCIEEVKVDKTENRNTVNDDFSRILSYVSMHYKEDISLKDLSNEFNYTIQYISMMFKKYLNQNFYKYLMSLRLERSKILLTTTNNKILDIAFESGFNTEHSYINNFKKYYALTPSQYRKQKKQ
ncbi:MAG: AraC family transcriptional regulator [Bacillota bacterium]|nr:AraC family transcriptional regulator [Bacillota bacterium]